MEYDLAIINGIIVDGSGGPWLRGDVATKDGSISEVGTLSTTRAKRVIDARNLVVAPGFIDGDMMEFCG